MKLMITCNEIYRSMRSQGFFDGLEKKGLLVDNRLRLKKIREDGWKLNMKIEDLK
ncbi:hypothetical protein LCGC14_2915360 [marine sediment metagenome]|uniref:Uncharacterized protein n=1 Tax=marine sediment metagenome TaxID=412755 RepID=A0A0F8XQF9_9ZZZZ